MEDTHRDRGGARQHAVIQQAAALLERRGAGRRGFVMFRFVCVVRARVCVEKFEEFAKRRGLTD